MPEQDASPNPNGLEKSNSITLSRGQKGTYAWEIKLRWPVGAAADQTLDDLNAIDKKLFDAYPTA
jgi:hypothetical protein